MSMFTTRKRTSRHWHVGIIRHFRPRDGFHIELLVVIDGASWTREIQPERLDSVGPYEASVEVIDELLRQTPWTMQPDELRLNDSELAHRLSRTARWFELTTVTNDHRELESARAELEQKACSVARWLSEPRISKGKEVVDAV